jgi:uncharacterized protein (DUF736 family)
MPDYDNELRGVLFPVSDKASETHPDFTGSVTVAGVAYFCDGWKNVSKAGKRFVALRLKRKDKQPNGGRGGAERGADGDGW